MMHDCVYCVQLPLSYVMIAGTLFVLMNVYRNCGHCAVLPVPICKFVAVDISTLLLQVRKKSY